ncbi:MAG: GspH/FimT family pseudopilin [Sideroxydans sp.]|nr:GspH/FimT family pseudopilin [Sideroxydans sp.]
MQTKSSQAGFTLIELLIVIVIGAILVAIGGPSFSDFINNTKQTSTMTRLVSDLNRARSETIKRNTRVLICARNTAGTDCVSSTNWQNGWLVCYDADQNNACDTAPIDGSNPNPISLYPAVSSKLTLTGSNNATTPIRFNPSGTQGTGGVATLTLTGTWSGSTAKIVNVAATGLISKQ